MPLVRPKAGNELRTTLVPTAMSEPPRSLRSRRSRIRLGLLLLVPPLTIYALCWVLAVVSVPVTVTVVLPEQALQSTARATLYLESDVEQPSERTAPLTSPLKFEWEATVPTIRHFWKAVDRPRARVEVAGCEPLAIPVECGTWSIRAPDLLTLGSWEAGFSRKCSGRGVATCAAKE